MGGCATPSIPDFEERASLERLSVQLEELALDPVTGASSVEGFVIVANLDGALSLVEPLEEDPEVLLGVGPAVRDAAWMPDGSLLIATDEGLLRFEDYLSDSPLALALSDEIVSLARDGDDLWIRTAAGLHRWRDDVLTTVEWAGEALDGPFATGGVVSGRPVIWASGAQGLVALHETRAGSEALATWSAGEAGELSAEGHAPADGLAAAASGQLWAAVDGLLVRYTVHGWRGIALPVSLTGVRGSPASSGVWLLADGALLWAAGEDIVQAIDLPGDASLPGDVAGTDELGRLLLAGDSGLYRVASARVVAIVGLRSGDEIAGETAITLLPSEPARVASLTAEVDGTTLDILDDVLTIDPFDFLGSEVRTLTVTATWKNDAVATASVSFTVGSVSGITWTDHIEPIYQDTCAICHDGGTETELNSREIWEERVDDILDEVVAGRMPLGGGSLTDAEIALIRSWKDGGFPE